MAILMKTTDVEKSGHLSTLTRVSHQKMTLQCIFFGTPSTAIKYVPWYTRTIFRSKQEKIPQVECSTYSRKRNMEKSIHMYVHSNTTFLTTRHTKSLSSIPGAKEKHAKWGDIHILISHRAHIPQYCIHASKYQMLSRHFVGQRCQTKCEKSPQIKPTRGWYLLLAQNYCFYFAMLLRTSVWNSLWKKRQKYDHLFSNGSNVHIGRSEQPAYIMHRTALRVGIFTRLHLITASLERGLAASRPVGSRKPSHTRHSSVRKQNVPRKRQANGRWSHSRPFVEKVTFLLHDCTTVLELSRMVFKVTHFM